MSTAEQAERWLLARQRTVQAKAPTVVAVGRTRATERDEAMDRALHDLMDERTNLLRRVALLTEENRRLRRHRPRDWRGALVNLWWTLTKQGG